MSSVHWRSKTLEYFSKPLLLERYTSEKLVYNTVNAPYIHIYRWQFPWFIRIGKCHPSFPLIRNPSATKESLHVISHFYSSCCSERVYFILTLSPVKFMSHRVHNKMYNNVYGPITDCNDFELCRLRAIVFFLLLFFLVSNLIPF